MTSSVVKMARKPGRPAASERVQDERPTYNGGLSAEELERPGGKLLAMLMGRANQLGITQRDMAEKELGVTYGYIHQLRSGHRETSNISDQFAAQCALFLGVPKVVVLMASGRVSMEDYFTSKEMAALEIPRALAFVLEDPAYGLDLGPDVRDLSLSSQYGIVRMYEKATGKNLLSNAITMDNLATQLKRLEDVQDELRKQAASGTSSSAEKTTSTV